MKSNKQKPPVPWPYILAFLCLFFTVLLLGRFYNNYQRNKIIQEKESELSAIADLKVNQIEKWRDERLCDGKIICDNPSFVRQLVEYIITDGFVLIRVDPEKILYPIVKTWPTPSKTSKTLLVRQEGDSILYLTDLRHLVSTALSLKLSLSDSTLPATRAVRGFEGSMTGVDYRKVTVIASTRKIKGSPWYLVAKTDLDELLTDLNKEMFLINIVIALFIVSMASVFGLMWRHQRSMYYRGKYEVELDRLALIKHFDYILKYANDIILLIDSDLTILEANDRALELYLYNRNELIGMNVKKLTTPEVETQFFSQKKIIDEKGFAIFETIHMRKDNTVLPLEISAHLVNIEGVRYYQTIGRDITKRKLIEDSLLESEEKFRKIFEESPLCMVLTGSDFGIERANLSFIRMIGYSEDELLYNTFRTFTHSDDAAKDEVSLMRLIAGEIPAYSTEKKYIRKDKSVIWGSTTISIIRNNKGGIQHFLAMVEDITSTKAAKIELELSFSILKATLESTADGILVVDASGAIIQFNQKIIEMWKIPQEIMNTGKDSDALEFVQGQLTNPESFLDNVKQLYLNNEIMTFDILEFKDGRFFERYSQPQKINGKSVGRVWSFRDITEKKRSEAEVIAAKIKAEESDKLKTAFLHNVSHEIRTPMNAIIGFSTLLNDLSLNEPEYKQYTDIIFQSGTQLLSIINDIVDIANVESGQVKLNFSEISLNSVLSSLNDQFSYNELDKDVKITFKSNPSQEDIKVVTDNTKLIQILSNLINNAIKFTKTGHIDFGYELKDNFVEFYVNDSGIGIPLEYQSRIFDRFYQVYSSGSRQYGGTGLGLSICKAYVELLGGKIRLTSEEGVGSLFFFTIPYRRA